MRRIWVALILVGVLSGPGWTQERLTEPYLQRGELEPARQAVLAALAEQPGNAELLVQLALVQVFQSLESYAQTMYRLGLRDSFFDGMLPFLRIPLEPNPEPEQATNREVREALDRFARGLAEARATLVQVPDSWEGRVPLRLGLVRLDIDGDGVARPKEELWRLLDAINPGLMLEEKTARQFGLHVDAGDVRWLEGYCHILEGLADAMLAYDTQRLFDHTGHLFFLKAASPYPFLDRVSDDFWWNGLVDAISCIHLVSLPLAQAERMPSALEHFQQTIALSRRSWACIQAETDNTYEWIPNPRQKGAISGWTVSEEQVARWLEFLDEAEMILAGKVLIPFWRPVGENEGVSLARVFLEPRPFDLVLWVQGPGAAPYLEEGTVTSSDLWRRLDEAFNGQFFGFAAWFN